MKITNYREKVKKKMGLKWYWYYFLMYFDIPFQYDNWLMRRHVYHLRKIDKIVEEIKNRNYGD